MTASTKAKSDLDAIEARARETARRLGLGEEPEEWEIAELTEQIHQAEQAAFQQGWNERDAIDLAFHPEIEKARADERRKTLEDAGMKIRAACPMCDGGYAPESTPDDPVECEYCGRPMAVLRALANQPSEPGEAA